MFPNPYLLFTSENCILFLLLLRTAYCCTLIFSAQLQLLHESLLASFSSSSTLELNTSIHTTPYPTHRVDWKFLSFIVSF